MRRPRLQKVRDVPKTAYRILACLVLGSGHAFAKSAMLPHYPVEQICGETHSNAFHPDGTSNEPDIRQCISAEQSHYDTLQSEWPFVPDAVKQKCVAQVQKDHPKSLQYSDLDDCIGAALNEIQPQAQGSFRY